MKWLLLIMFLAIVGVFAYLGYVVFAVFTSLEEVNSCTVDSDCIIMEGVDLCKNPVSINKEHKFKWEKKTSYTHWLYELTLQSRMCEQVYYNAVSSCENNKCIVLS